MPSDASTDYIDSLKYTDWQLKLKDLVAISNELESKVRASRRLRYSQVDVEGERKASRLAPDEVYIPLHLIDTNVRREQSSYIQYVTQSNRAVVLTNVNNPAISGSILERDVTNRLRFDGWQLSMYPMVDGFQQNGYGVMEVVHDQSKAGEVAHECVMFGDFGFINDTKDLQECEMVLRKYFYSKTKLKALGEIGKFDAKQVKRITDGETSAQSSGSESVGDKKDKSLYRVYKVMFRVKGTVHVAWTCEEQCDDWLSVPKPLFIGRKAVNPLSGLPEDVYETQYPYFLFPYTISENDTISQLVGRVYLDQDVQEAASSLISSYCTAHRRASGLYFSKDSDDPNNDNELQKNVYFRQGALINSKIKQFQLTPPSAEMLQAIQSLITTNMQETSQVNFAAQNRKDSRKTATEISAATQSASALTTVQVVLFSTALRQMYQLMFDIIRSRVLTGLIKVDPVLGQLYAQNWQVKPSGDTDVIERQQLIQMMTQAWPVMQNTPANVAFMSDLLEKMFPDNSAKYIQIIQQSQQSQQQAQQAQMQQMAGNIVEIARHPEFFSDLGKKQVLPQIQAAAKQIEQAQGKG